MHGNQIWFNSKALCPKCRQFRYSRVSMFKDGKAVEIAGACANPQCAPPINLLDKGMTFPFPQPFVTQIEQLCEKCHHLARLEITRGDKLVVGECLACGELEIPSKEEPLPTLRPCDLEVRQNENR